MNPIAKSLDVPLVPYREWLQALEDSSSGDESKQRNPALRLLEFFCSGVARMGPEWEPVGVARLRMTKARLVSATLMEGAMPCLGEEDVQRWLRFWAKNERV